MNQLTEFQKFSRGITILERYSPDGILAVGQSIPRISIILTGIEKTEMIDKSDIDFLHFLGWKYERNTSTAKGIAVMFGFFLQQPPPRSMGSIEGLRG